MRVAAGRVVNGRIGIEGDALPEGTIVRVVVLDEEEYPVSDEERSFLLASLRAVLRGATTSGLEPLEEIGRAE